ncbi:MAG: hypothetical protein HY852_03495 [Bradyrhizobium sp.]|uniref:hypothetical protein n=1 Tax=Bradyrhizobium sp. TaxID=376 RepID=UPI0025C66F03|nr:hypothetical protein [Bradyrhizobium sp.]MBI5260867.1 hypothetical protein [Bradyrhizobium sp.]
MNKVVAVPVAAAASIAAPAFAEQMLPAHQLAPTLQPEAAPDPDAAILELGREFERLLAIEQRLEVVKSRLHEESDLLQCRKLGIDLDDREARDIALMEHSRGDLYRSWTIAARESGYSNAADKWNRASEKTGRVGKKVFKLAPPKTLAGLMVRVRVIETHDEIFDDEPLDMLLDEIRQFAERASA